MEAGTLVVQFCSGILQLVLEGQCRVSLKLSLSDTMSRACCKSLFCSD